MTRGTGRRGQHGNPRGRVASAPGHSVATSVPLVSVEDVIQAYLADVAQTRGCWNERALRSFVADRTMDMRAAQNHPTYKNIDRVARLVTSEIDFAYATWPLCTYGSLLDLLRDRVLPKFPSQKSLEDIGIYDLKKHPSVRHIFGWSDASPPPDNLLELSLPSVLSACVQALAEQRRAKREQFDVDRDLIPVLLKENPVLPQRLGFVVRSVPLTIQVCGNVASCYAQSNRLS